ncbi:hypothetical protein JZU69_00230, partial [bacterium]|nr:hypothetical protein [bacterium]
MKPNIPAAIADRFPANDVAAILAAPAWTEYELLGLCYGFNPFVERVNVGQFLGYEWYEVADVLFK